MKAVLSILRALLSLPGIISGLLHRRTQRQRDTAQRDVRTQEHRAEAAEAAIEQRAEADHASAAAKREGDKLVEAARAEARTGRRDHFERGMYDDTH